MRRNRSSKKRIDTTLGDLIGALSEVALEQCKDAKEAYTLAGLVLTDVLSNCWIPSDAEPNQGGATRNPRFITISISTDGTGLLCDDETAQSKKEYKNGLDQNI